MIQRKAAGKLTNIEINSYDEPVNYTSHHDVLDSIPVPVPVFNSSALFMGNVLNIYWMKYLKIFNDVISVLLKFRVNQIAHVGELSKMYNSVR